MSYCFILHLFVHYLIFLPPSILAERAISRVIIVDPSGHGQFRKLRHAINSVPSNNNNWVEIQIRAGIYNEKVTIPYEKPYISLVGESRHNTVIQWSDGGGSATLEYSTFSVFADNFVARNITFKNTFHPDIISQAPAMVIYGDKVAFYECGFVGVQDTLTDFIGRHYFEGCYIEGYVDFIWGYGQSIYHGCVINITSGSYDDRIYGAGYITAQGRASMEDPDGFVFKYCIVVGTSLGYLGRPYQSYSRVVFYKSYLSNVVVPQGWNPGFTLGHEEAITHEEVDCIGPGADMSKRVKWGRSLNTAELNYLLNPNAFINQDHWIENLPFSYKRPNHFRSIKTAHKRVLSSHSDLLAHPFAVNNQDQDQDQGIDLSKVAYTITVSQSGNGNFTTVSDALDSVPSGNKKWIRIYIHPGIYEEQIEIHEDKPCIVVEGRDRSSTTITFDIHDTTSESATFAVYADNFLAKGITFKNSLARKHVPAVALRASGDKNAFYSCGFEGYQDTLWDDQGRHYFDNCYIEGAIDFIWGSGQSMYEKCTINVIGEGYITAQGRESLKDPSGFVFKGCDISGSGHGFLGRAYGPYSRVIYIESKFSDVVDPEGWFIWHQHGHENDITYAEADCTGPGSDTSRRVSWRKTLSSSEVDGYSRQVFIDQDGWIEKLP